MSANMETRTLHFQRYTTDASTIVERINRHEQKGWAVRQVTVIAPSQWIVVFERPKASTRVGAP